MAPSSDPLKQQFRRFPWIVAAELVLFPALYIFWLQPHTGLDRWLVLHIAGISTDLLSLMGFEASQKGALILLSGQALVRIIPDCNGLVVYAVFAGFVLAFPGPWGHKAWYIPLGIALLYGVNIARIVLLTANHKVLPALLDFNHRYSFVLVTYLAAFGLWVWWVKGFSGVEKLRKTQKTRP